MNTLRSIQNPASAMDVLLSQKNPAFKQAMDYVKASGGDPREALIRLANEKGYDAEAILREIEN